MLSCMLEPTAAPGPPSRPGVAGTAHVRRTGGRDAQLWGHGTICAAFLPSDEGLTPL